MNVGIIVTLMIFQTSLKIKQKVERSEQNLYDIFYYFIVFISKQKQQVLKGTKWENSV